MCTGMQCVGVCTNSEALYQHVVILDLAPLSEYHAFSLENENDILCKCTQQYRLINIRMD